MRSDSIETVDTWSEGFPHTLPGCCVGGNDRDRDDSGAGRSPPVHPHGGIQAAIRTGRPRVANNREPAAFAQNMQRSAQRKRTDLLLEWVGV
jgi:hypothetical protein